LNLWIFSNSMNILLEHLYTNVWVIYFQTYSITILPLICILEMGLIFVLKYHSKKMCEASLKICGPKIWNALHADIRESKSIYIFKKGFKFKLFNWPQYVLQINVHGVNLLFPLMLSHHLHLHSHAVYMAKNLKLLPLLRHLYHIWMFVLYNLQHQ